MTTQPSLAGIRILDLTRLLPGAFATLVLADLGADVIKIESPDGGDYARLMPPLVDGMGALFRLLNRNKRSVVLDLKDEQGQAVLHRLVQTADVLVESYRPGVMARLGCSADTLRALNPRLIYCALSGYGQTGPAAELHGHDLNYVGSAGILGAMHTPQPLGGQIADLGGAYAAVAGILAALFRRERTGVGAALDISLFEGALPFGSIQWIEAIFGTGMSLTGRYACYNVYRARDGQPCALAALEPKFWANFCRAVGREDLIDSHLQIDKQDYLLIELRELFALRPLAEWVALLHDKECCFSVVTPPEHLVDQSQVRARAALGIDADGVPWLASPVRLDSPRVPMTPPPQHGEHTALILKEAAIHV